MSNEEQEAQRVRDQEDINSAVHRRHEDGLSEAMRHDRTLRYLSLIWLLIVGGLIGYAMASCLADLVERA